MIAFADQNDDFARFAELVLPGFAPRPLVPSWEWVCRYGRTPEAQPFDGNMMPWAKGVCEAWDDPKVREIVLMWGTRLGKTMVTLQLVAKAMATNPLPGLFATANEKLATRTTSNKIYKVLAAISQTRRQLLPPRFRSIREIRLTESTWPVIWSGSNTMLADWGACYGWANEVSKWDEKKSTDGVAKAGDTLSQFLERFKEYWGSRKVVFECSPALKGKCKIERKYLESNQCRYHVPCPSCKSYQILKMGDGDPKHGGIVFEKTADGRLDADLAQHTAKYVCEHCGKSIRDEQRARMMRCGVWAPKGCRVDRKGKVCGKPERTCDIWGGQLSSLYSLQMRWGDIARKFVESFRNPALLQVFKNDWLAETWEPYHIKSEPEEVAERLATEDSIDVMPEWSTHLIAAVDVQAEYFKWIKLAAGPDERAAIVSRGFADTWGEVEAALSTPTPHADGGAPLLPCLTLIDSGDGKRTKEVYEMCRKLSRPERIVLPCKGANSDMGGSPYEVREIIPGMNGKTKLQRRKALRSSGNLLIRVNSFYYEPIIQRWLDSREPGESDSLSVPRDLADDDEFIDELCNGTMSDNASKMSPDRVLWVKRWDSQPNDFRDCLKYARCAIDLKFRGRWQHVQAVRQPGNTAEATERRPVIQREMEEDSRRRPRMIRQRLRRERLRGR